MTPLVLLLALSACGGGGGGGGGGGSSISDVTAPTLSSTSPDDGGTGAPLNTKVAATFSEAMNAATVNGTTFRLEQGATPVTGTVTYTDVGTTAQFTPAAPLAANTTYTATITSGAQDPSNNAVSANYIWSFRTGATTDTTRPTVTLRSPLNLATGVAVNQGVTGTFSEDMDAATIGTSSFTLAGPGSTPVSGAVFYDAANRIATFRSTNNLAGSTTFTATLTTALKDLAGNTILSNDVWTFTTGAAPTIIGPESVNLRSAADFAILAFNTVTNVNSVGTTVNGDLGIFPGSAVTGFPPGILNGSQKLANPTAQQAQADLLAAFNDAAGRPNPAVLAGNLGGLTFTPGLYKNSSSVLISGSGPGNNVTLDAQGDANATFIFQIGSTLTTGPGSQVILSGNAKAANVFWIVGTSATLNTTSIFKGNILAASAVSLKTGASLEGRALARNAAVALDSNVITTPAP